MENYLKTLLESMTPDELVQRILEISSSAETLSKKVVNAEELVKSLEEELARVDKKHYADVQKLRERLEAKNGLIDTLRSQLDSAKNTIEALKSRNNDNNEITTDLELDNRRLQVRIQELEKQLKLAAEFGDACLDKVRDLEMKNGKLNENAKNYERKIDLQNESIHKLEERIVDLETKRDDFMEVIENQKATIQHIDKCRDELETKLTESDGIRKAISEENDKLNRRTWELQRENLVLEHEIKNLNETKLGVINSFNIDCEGEYLEIMLTRDAGKSFMRNVKVFKEGTAIKVSDFVETEKPVTPKDLWEAGEKVVACFAAGVKIKQPEEPLCKSVPCSTVIGKLENYWVNSEGVRIQVRLSEKASEYFKATKAHTIGEEIDIRDLQMKMPDSLQILRTEVATRFLQKPYKTDYERTAEHIWNKYRALRKAGFDDDQAMCLIPMWDDEVDE